MFLLNIHPIILVGAVILFVGLMILNAGGLLVQPSYSRRKMLTGISANEQIRNNRRAGIFLLKVGLFCCLASIIVSMVLVGVYPIRTEYSRPEAVTAVHDQGQSVFIIDGKVIQFDYEYIPYIVDSDYPCLLKEMDFTLLNHRIASRYKIFFYPECLEQYDDEIF